VCVGGWVSGVGTTRLDLTQIGLTKFNLT